MARVHDGEKQTPTAERVPLVAAELFRRRGYAATSVRDIADGLGITKASLYYHVTEKEELLRNLSVDALRHIHSAVESTVKGTRGPRDRLATAIRAHVVAMLAERDMHATMLTEMRHLSGDMRDEVVHLRDSYDQLMRSLVAEAQGAGQLRTDWSAKHLTLALLNLLNWTIFWWDPQGDLDADSVADLLLSVFLDGTTVEVD